MNLESWETRGNVYGHKAVLDITWDRAQCEAYDHQQWPILAAAIKKQLHGHERKVLDFGCGFGRLSGRLAQLTQGRVVGYDPTKSIIALAQPQQRVTFTTNLPDETFNLIFMVHVLGAIPDSQLYAQREQVLARLQPGGLIFFAEHIAEVSHTNGFWWTRTVENYQQLFEAVNLKAIEVCNAAGNSTMMFSGRRALEIL